MTQPEQVAYEDLSDAEVRKLADDNHIWLNAFNCINPSKDFMLELANAVLTKLEYSNVRATKLSNGKEPVGNTVILRINKS